MSLWTQQLLLVMLGGALGAAGRYWMGGLLLRHLGNGFPWGTLGVNLLGSFAAGFLAGEARSLGLEQSLKLGAICAAEVIQHYGARPEADLRTLAGDLLA